MLVVVLLSVEPLVVTFLFFRVLVEIAMAQKHFDVVDSLLKSVPKELAKNASFRERYKVFLLNKWVEKDGWKTEEPKLILAILQDNVSASEADSLIQQAAAQVRRFQAYFFPLFFSSVLCRSLRRR